MEWRKSLACALALAGMMAFGPGVRQAALAADTHNLTILGGGSGGLWAIISEGVGETLRRSMPNVRVTTEPGKDGPNQVMTSRGEVQFALATDVLTLKAIKGEAPFKGRKLDNLRLVAVMNPINALQFFVDAKTGAKSIQDIKDKKIPLRITVNRQGTLIDVATEELLKTYGITYSDIAKWGGKVHKIPGPEATDLWDAGQMDAIVEVSQVPTSRFYELGQKHDLIMLPIDPANQEKLNKELGTSSLTIPAGTYSFQKDDCPTVSSQLLLITSADQPGHDGEHRLPAQRPREPARPLARNDVGQHVHPHASRSGKVLPRTQEVTVASCPGAFTGPHVRGFSPQGSTRP